ncbi:MAG: hypothetical protein GY790_14155 [Bacteroidetes bacterium]|nr:hypothetical protein [Bacteroidota bacterium]
MTARDRILMTLAGTIPDRVPVCPIVFENYIRQYYADPEINVMEATVHFLTDIGADIIHRNCYPWLYLFVETTGPINDNWQVSIEHSQAGSKKQWNTSVRTPGGDLRVVCEARTMSRNEDAYAYMELPIKETKDLDLLHKYEPAWSHDDVDTSALRDARKGIADRGVTSPWVQGVFNFAGLYYRNFEHLLMDPYADEGFYRALMEHALEQNWSYLKVLIENGADAFAYGGNLAGGEVGPQFFEQFVLEYESELIHRIHNSGGRIIWHNCGKSSTLWGLYPKTGMDCFESLAQAPEGDTDLGEIKLNLGAHVALSGGVDQKDFLLKATVAEVEHRVAEVLEVMKPGGAYILSTVDYLSEDTPIGNIKAFVEAGKKYGAY